MAGGFVAGHQPLVAVHQWIGDGTASPYVSQQSRDELIGQRGQVPGIRLVIEGIFPIRNRDIFTCMPLPAAR